MNHVQPVIIIIGAVGFLWFFLPFAAKGILNIGNLTGMLVFLLLMLYGIFQKRAHLLFRQLWSGRGTRIALFAAMLFAAAVVLLVAIETFWMVRAALNKPPANTPAVVLGCSVKGTRPSRILEERLIAAAEYLKENPEAVCILSGGQGEGEDISEAECMYRYLTEQGIESSRLYLEDTSTTTAENLENSKVLLEELGLGDEIAIVTSEFHSYRASVMAEKLGYKSYSVSASTHFLYLPTYYVRELYGIIYYMVGK